MAVKGVVVGSVVFIGLWIAHSIAVTFIANSLSGPEADILIPMLSSVFWVGSFGIAGYVAGRIVGSSEIVYGIVTGIAVLMVMFLIEVSVPSTTTGDRHFSGFGIGRILVVLTAAAAGGAISRIFPKR
jgi:hypothetical protein